MLLESVERYERSVLEDLGIAYEGLDLCELGDQVMWSGGSAKDAYAARGVRHTSLDLNGRRGALVVDLEHPVPSHLVGSFDVVTDYGTIEHVGDQYQAWANVHDMCRVGGVMIHSIPAVEHWPDHCRYYYTLQVVEELAELCAYRPVRPTVLDEHELVAPRNLVSFGLVKTAESVFPTRDAFARGVSIIDTGDTRRTGNYTQGLVTRRMKRLVAWVGRLTADRGR